MPVNRKVLLFPRFAFIIFAAADVLFTCQGKDVFVEQVQQIREILAHGLTVWYSGSLNAFVQEVGKDLFVEPALSPLYDRVE